LSTIGTFFHEIRSSGTLPSQENLLLRKAFWNEQRRSYFRMIAAKAAPPSFYQKHPKSVIFEPIPSAETIYSRFH
jgi:hypothetical protein